MKEILLNPGPVTLSPGVRAAAIRVDMCHREPEYLRIQQDVISGLTAVYGCDPAQWTTVILGGSGTIAMEAMLSSVVGREESVLIIDNGVYGQRLAQMARIHGIRHEIDQYPWGHALDLQRIEGLLAENPFVYVAVVHHETTTGRLNPVAELADVCKKYETRLLVDAVSSFGAENIPFQHPALAACAATANKCLHGIPGLAFVVLRKELLELELPQRSLYMNLATWASKQQVSSTPFTPPVNAVLALEQALAELRQQGGWKVRKLRYEWLANELASVLAATGVQPWLGAEDSSCVLRSYRLPETMNYQGVHDCFKKNGFTIYGGQGDLSQYMFRISTMGDIDDLDLARLKNTIREIFGS